MPELMTSTTFLLQGANKYFNILTNRFLVQTWRTTGKRQRVFNRAKQRELEQLTPKESSGDGSGSQEMDEEDEGSEDENEESQNK